MNIESAQWLRDERTEQTSCIRAIIDGVMTKSDVTQILTELAVIKTKMENVENRVSKVERFVMYSVGTYFTVTFTGFVGFILVG